VAVDTAPVMEKNCRSRRHRLDGKHTCIVNEEIGSWILLGELLTTLSLWPDEPPSIAAEAARAAFDACQTGAIRSVST